MARQQMIHHRRKRPSVKNSYRAGRKSKNSGLTYGKVFSQGTKLVQYGYRGGKKVGLFLYSAAKTYNKAKYTYKAGRHAYRLVRK